MIQRAPFGCRVAISVCAAWATCTSAAVLVDDPLQASGPLVGQRFTVVGGTFASGGWKVVGKNDCIIWHVASLTTGAVEFDVKGLNPWECRTGMQDHSELFHMYDYTFGNSDYQYNGGYRENPYKHFVRKAGAGYWSGDPPVFTDCRGHPKTDSMEILWKVCPGNDSTCQENYLESDTSVLAWDPAQTYHFRLEWQSSGSTGRLKTFRNGVQIMDQSLSGTYAPAGLSIRIGASPRGDTYAGAPIDAVFSSLKVYDSTTNDPPSAPTIVSPTEGATVTNRVAFVQWTGDTHTQYQVRINTQNSVESGILFDSADAVSPWSYCFSSELPDNGTCYAFVRLGNSAGYGNWSAGRQFMVSTASAPPGPALVQLDGNVFKDNSGYFRGLGATYMQAMRRCYVDRTRFISDLDFLASRGINYVRILSMVGWYAAWDGLEIAPVSFTNQNGKAVAAWPTYWQQFRDCIDLIYSHGMRAEITVFADAQLMPAKQDRIDHMNLILQNLAGREHKVMFLEVANEAWQNGFPGTQGIADLQEFARYLADRTSILVSITSNDDTSTAGISNLYCGSAADLATVHFDRDISTLEGGWLPVRDCWRVGDVLCLPPVTSNEPIGSGSSVSSENDPVKLVSAAMFAWIAGLPGYVYHTSAGVFGLVRFEDMAGVNNFAWMGGVLPADLSGWVRNDGLEASAPFTVFANGQADKYWPDVPGASSGVVRNCGKIKGNEFICLPMGILSGGVDLQARRLVAFTVYDPLDGSMVGSHIKNAGETLHLAQGPQAYLIKGTFTIPTEVTTDLGSPDVANGLNLVSNADGDTSPVTIGDRVCRCNLDPAEDFYFYFAVSDGFAYQASKPELWMTISYFDMGAGALSLEYDSSGGSTLPYFYKMGGIVTLTNSATWKQFTFHVPDAYFGNRQNAGADFRIGSVGNVFYLDTLRVSTVEPVPPVIGSFSFPEYLHPLVPYLRQLVLTQGSPAPTWRVVQGPAGAQVDATGRVSGWTPQPGQFGTVTFEVEAANSEGRDTATWFVRVVSRADFDLDDDVDQEDFGLLQICLSGEGMPYRVGCEPADLTGDDDVDLEDLLRFATCLSGPGRPPQCLE